MPPQTTQHAAPSTPWRRTAAAVVGWALVMGCAAPTPPLKPPDPSRRYPAGTILHAATGHPTAFDALIDDLLTVGVVYVGEQHIHPGHHAVQLRILEAVHRKAPSLAVGMEMVDRTYDPVLAEWTAGRLGEPEFIQLTHWYANWRYDYALYRDIFDFIRAEAIPLFGLNLPFHVPAKIATGGLASLRPDDAEHLPDAIDLTDTAHRAYVEEVHRRHQIPGRENVDFFYEAQCAWDEAMAEAVADRHGTRRLIVFAGNGHIVHKFGIPNRAFRRTGVPFRTVVLVTADQPVDISAADYIWVTESLASARAAASNSE